MKTIGLIGGMSWESTVTYYQLINREIAQRLGGFHSAKILLHSVDFAEIETCQAIGDWHRSGEILTQAAIGLENTGADFLLLCTNTMHKVYSHIQNALSIPVLHIAQATATALQNDKIHQVALLGTRYTMTQNFYKKEMEEMGIKVLIPQEADIDIVHTVIYDELCHGHIRDRSRNEYLRIIQNLRESGAEAVILGCTEIGLLISDAISPLPVYDTTIIHARAAVEQSLA